MTDLNKQYADARAQMITSMNRVLELAGELAQNVRPRPNLDKAMSAMSLFVVLPKGKQYQNDFAVVEHCLNKGAINRDLFEMAVTATGFIK